MENPLPAGFSSYLSRLRDAALHYCTAGGNCNEKKFTNLSYIILLVFVLTFLSYAQDINLKNTNVADGWRLAKGTEGFAAADIDIYYSDPDTMYAIGGWTNGDTTFHSGFLISTDRGENWEVIRNCPATDVGAVRVDPFDSKRIYVSVYGFDDESNDIWMTKDGGVTWTRLFGGRSYPAAVVEIDPVDLRTVYVGVGPAFIRRSTDRGETWESIITPPAPYPPFLNALTIAPSNDSILYAAYVTGLFKSTDKGTSWIKLPLDAGHWGISCVVVDPHDANIVYAGVFSRGLPPGGVFKSTDGGLTWEEKNNGLDSTNWDISSLLVNPKEASSVFLGTYTTKGTDDTVGVFRTTTGGNAWIPFNYGLPGGVYKLAFDNVYNRLYGAALGIYFNDSLVTSVHNSPSSEPETFSLFQNYPNPFNGTTTITYELSERAFVDLSLYDVLGRKVRTLLEDSKNPGTYKVTMEGGDLPSGIYFYRLTAGTNVLVRKAVLIK